MPSGVYERKRWMKSAGKITPEVKEEIRGRRGEGESWTSIARGLEEKGLKLSRQSVRRAWVGEWNGSRRKVVACLRCGGDVTRGEKFCTKACKRICQEEFEKGGAEIGIPWTKLAFEEPFQVLDLHVKKIYCFMVYFIV